MSKKNKTVRVQDDLYQHVNGEWIKNAVIPADKPMTGGFASLHEDVEMLLMNDCAKLADGEETADIPVIADAVRLYKKVLAVKERGEAGMKPLYPLLEKIKSITSVSDFNGTNVELLYDRVPFPFEIEVIEDWKDTSRHCLFLSDPSLVLPDTSYYDKKLTRRYLLGLYKKMTSAILQYSPLSRKEQKQYLQDTIAFDDLIRRKALSQREMADYYKMYNSRDTKEVCELLAPFDLAGLLEKMYGNSVPEKLVLANPRLIEGFKEIFSEKTFPLFIHWCYVNTIYQYAPTLSAAIYSISQQAMNKVIGIKEMPSIEKQAFRLVSSVYDQPIGIYYGRKYFGEKAKKDITSIVREIIQTYEHRIRNNQILSDETKEKAILKLSSIHIKMGYPDECDPFFDTLTVSDDDTFFDAMDKISRLKKKHQFDKLNKPTDPDEWQMPGHMVNACYDPFRNDITFPAAILQKPFYSVEQKKEENLGGIGAVIGHEISHAFDNNGSHFDEKGNLFDWWKKEDFETFEEKTKDMTAQFDGIPFHGGKVNGGLVVSENIADNGGMAVTLEIMHTLENPDFEAYFLNWARIWCMKAKKSYTKILLTMDVHSPCELRANTQPRNFSEWYDTFGVQPTDKMYIPEDKRIIIW